MNKLLVASLAAFYGASAVAIDKANSLFHTQPEAYDFETYMQEFDKTYDTEEEIALRKEIFSANLEKILALNAGFENGERTWRAGVNKFTDLSPEEFKRFKGFNSELLGEKSFKADNIFRLENEQDRTLVEFPEISDFPTSVDWRSKSGVVTPVKDQGGCGSCWAFSSAETVESAVALATGKPAPILAPQQYVDCVKNPQDCGGTGGCEGATQPIAFNYTIPVGLTSEAQYPYRGDDGPCRKFTPVAGIKGMVVLATNNWTQLMAATAEIGPIAISVAAEPWQFYDSGIFSKDCGADIDHAVQAVGYGVEGSTPYWIVRNSWGEGWGEQGYIRVLRAASEADVKCRTDSQPGDGFGCKNGPKTITVCGECGILSGSSYVTGAFLYPAGAPEVEEF